MHVHEGHDRAEWALRLRSRVLGFRQHTATGAWTWDIKHEEDDQQARRQPRSARLATSTCVPCCFGLWRGRTESDVVRTPIYEHSEGSEGTPFDHRLRSVKIFSFCLQVGSLASPLAKLAQVIGVPLIRLRLAIPEEMLPGSIGSGTRLRT